MSLKNIEQEFDKVYAPIFLEVNEGVGDDFKKRLKIFIRSAITTAFEETKVKEITDETRGGDSPERRIAQFYYNLALKEKSVKEKEWLDN